MTRSCLLSLLAGSAFLLYGCGGGDDGPTEPPPTVASVRVEAPDDVEIVEGTPTIAPGDSVDFDATATDGQGDVISASFTWTSLDVSVATVDDDGTAVGAGPGRTGIVARAENGVSDTTTLQVLDPDGPNLRAGSLDLIPHGVLTDGSVGAIAVVTNTGRPAGPYRLAVTEGERLLVSAGREGLAGGATDTVPLEGLGPFVEGPHDLTLEVDTDDDVIESDETDNTANARLESHPPGYDIEFQFVGEVLGGLRQTVLSEGGRWSEVITGDVDDVSPGPDGIPVDSCFTEPQGLSDRTEPIDDVLILVRQDSIDGPGDVLARAGPCFVRSDPSDLERPPIPVVGLMEFDVEDVVQAQREGFLADVVLHEMAHVLGFGGLWNFRGGEGDDVGPYQLREGTDTVDPRFVGAFAAQQYQVAGGEEPTVPVEGVLAPRGTRNSHWRESVFGTELMTGSIGPGENPLSAVTVGSFGDMFYAVDLAAAEPFSLDGSGAAAIGADRVQLGDHVLYGATVYGVTADGRVRELGTLAPRPAPGDGGTDRR